MKRIILFSLLLNSLVGISQDIDTQVKTDPCVPSKDIFNEEEVLSFVEIVPKYPGGESKMFSDISKKLKYPKEQESLQTKIYVTFIIDKAGKVQNPCIYRKFNENKISPLEQLTLEIIENMPTWVSGKQNGKNVPVRLRLPINIDVK